MTPEPSRPSSRLPSPSRLALVGLIALAACGDDGPERAEKEIRAETLARAIQDLAADSMEGRAPSSPGEERTVRYLRDRFQRLGLRPGNGESWVQEVSLVSLTAGPDMAALVEGRGPARSWGLGEDFVAVTERVVPEVDLESSELVFAGYGIVAPEYGWDDYADADAEGKTVVVLVNDPGYASGDPALFTGRSMTYYGRWTYKYEEAARQGADGVLVVHQRGPAGYPWEVVQTGWTGPQFLLDDGGAGPTPKVQGWLSEEAARRLFSRAGLNFDSLAARAGLPGFRPLSLGQRLSLRIRNEIQRSTSRNVLALLPGRARPHEVVIYMAHWDHLGMDPGLEGDAIYNGAVDNASGTAGLLEIARAFAALRRPPERSVLFLAVTAEEQGLLGSEHYAAHPAFPLDRTVAAINMDGLNVWGSTRDITVVGHGMSELEDLLAEAALARGRLLAPDPEPEKGFFFRSDHFEFARLGVPALYADPGVEDVARGEEWARARRDEYTAENYHKPGDEYDPSWDLRGAADDLRLLFRVGYRLAEGAAWPNWRVGSEFRAARDAMMGAAP